MYYNYTCNDVVDYFEDLIRKVEFLNKNKREISFYRKELLVKIEEGYDKNHYNRLVGNTYE